MIHKVYIRKIPTHRYFGFREWDKSTTPNGLAISSFGFWFFHIYKSKESK